MALGQSEFPDEEAIARSVALARQKRLLAESRLAEALSAEDSMEAEKARADIARAWAAMRDEAHFGTLILDARGGEAPVVLAWDGLPLRWVATDDAIGAARKILPGHKWTPVRYVFLGLYDLYVELGDGSDHAYVHLFTKRVVRSLPASTESSPATKPVDAGVRRVGKRSPMLSKTAEPQPPFEFKITGVPDYQVADLGLPRCCAPVACGCVLGYWDDRGYGELIKGGGSDYAGYHSFGCSIDWCTDGAVGWMGLIGCDLAIAIGYHCPEGSPPCNEAYGMRLVTNGFRDYAFTYYQYPSDYCHREDPWNHYDEYKAEINSGRPLVYALVYPTYGGGAGEHAVTGVDYGAIVVGVESMRSSQRDEASGEQSGSVERYYLVHDNNVETGVDVRLFWSDFMDRGRVITVHPGGSRLQTATAPSTSALALRAFPNPFNSSTCIEVALSKPSKLSVQIRNILGRTVYQSVTDAPAGRVRMLWDGTDLSGSEVPSGTYIVCARAAGEAATRVITLVK